ncbi:MAG: hypothetical protein JW751_10935 [Polyangiaceae bacterium]|nr:hypothetical protein [Polyangiaceae bacterium]
MTRELSGMFKAAGIDLWTLENVDLGSYPSEEFDDPLGIAAGAGTIFGTTGGVMEATLRTAAVKIANDPHAKLEFRDVRAVEGLREADVRLGEQVLHVGVANGFVNARKLLDMVVKGEKESHVIEVMACPGGCIGGGGQPNPPRRWRPSRSPPCSRR